MKIGIKLFFCFLVCSFWSCTSQPTPTNPFRSLCEFPNANVIGNVHVNFVSMSSHVRIVNRDAHYVLLRSARQEHVGHIDIVDISWISHGRERGGGWRYSATGRVISLFTSDGGIESVLIRAAEQTLIYVAQRSVIAIVFITAEDRGIADFVAGELEFIWVNEGYIIIDRSQLDRLRQEHNFHLSGDVDDETAVSIGRIAGANIIVTGRIDGEGHLRRLRLRAIDTETAQVVGVVSERL